MRGNRRPYSEETLAGAIRNGVDSDGRELSNLMPRFDLNDADVAALIAYLKTLNVRSSPGVVDGVVNFATIFTPDADSLKRQGVLDVLQHYVIEKNSFPFGPSPRMVTSGKTAYSKSMYMANRRWRLHVWDLTGPASGWRAQLEQHLAEQPVFAVLSGAGGSNWGPVHQFCEQHAVPCLFPNVEVPVVDEHAFYNLYFSKGVLLEAELIARSILDHATAGRAAGPALQVEQVFRAGDSGEPAAAALKAALQAQGVSVQDRRLQATQREHRDLETVVRKLPRQSVLVLWLRPDDIKSLAQLQPPRAAYMSALMAGVDEAPVPAGWRSKVLLAYPFDPPERRGVRLDYPLGWFAFRHIPIVAQQAQVDTYLACSLLADAVNHMADAFVRPYLIERLQGMLEHRIVTGYYPHLALGPNQRFASKGGYLVQLPDQGTQLVARSDWLVP